MHKAAFDIADYILSLLSRRGSSSFLHLAQVLDISQLTKCPSGCSFGPP
jgi:hypothetical protein